MKCLAILALLAVTVPYALCGGYGAEEETAGTPPPPPPYEEEAAEVATEDTIEAMETMDEAEGYEAEEPAAQEEEAPATEAPAEPEPENYEPEYIEEPEPAGTEAPAPEEPAADDGYETPEMPEAPPEEPEAEAAGTDAPAEEAPMEEAGGYRKRRFRKKRVFKLKEVRSADILLRYDINCMDFSPMCKEWASRKTKSGKSLCYAAKKRMLAPVGCRKSCNYCTNNKREWRVRRELAARKIARRRRFRLVKRVKKTL